MSLPAKYGIALVLALLQAVSGMSAITGIVSVCMTQAPDFTAMLLPSHADACAHVKQ